jgi:hypothetical protein
MATQSKAEMRAELINRGAELLKTEDRFGETKTGWWIDGVFLGENERDAIESIGRSNLDDDVFVAEPMRSEDCFPMY